MSSSYRPSQFIPEDSQPAPLKTRLLIWAVIVVLVGAAALLVTRFQPLYCELFLFAPDFSAYKKMDTFAQIDGDCPKQVEWLYKYTESPEESDRFKRAEIAPTDAQEETEAFLSLLQEASFRYLWYYPSRDGYYSYPPNVALGFTHPDEVPKEAFRHIGNVVDCGAYRIALCDDRIVVVMFLIDNTEGKFDHRESMEGLVGPTWREMRVAYVCRDKELVQKANAIFAPL